MKLTPLHYFVGFLGFLFVTMSLFWEGRDKRNCDADLKYYKTDDSIHKANYIELYDSMLVWKPIVKKARKKK